MELLRSIVSAVEFGISKDESIVEAIVLGQGRHGFVDQSDSVYFFSIFIQGEASLEKRK